MKKIAAVIALASILILGGCASAPNFSDVSKSLPALPANKGRIFVYRSSMEGAAVQTDVKLNGVAIGAASAGGVFYLDRLPGNYRAETTTEPSRPLRFTLVPGQTQYIRIHVAMGYMIVRLYPELVDPKTAAADLADCRLLGRVP